MLISQSWLTRILRSANPSFGVDAAELDTGFVRVGFETEGYEAVPETTGPLVLGRVDTVEELEGFQKPIRYCGVNVGRANGTGDLQHIICGARNFRQGDVVVVALPGAVLPGPFEISARKTYGRVSEGMMCSAAELGLARAQTAGIITLPESLLDEAGYALGDDARPVVGLDDTVFDVNVTPDRGYALSARGLARELASSFDLVFRDPATGSSSTSPSTPTPGAPGTACGGSRGSTRPPSRRSGCSVNCCCAASARSTPRRT